MNPLAAFAAADAIVREPGSRPSRTSSRAGRALPLLVAQLRRLMRSEPTVTPIRGAAKN